MSKLTTAQWMEIKTRYGLGDAIRAIARDYSISDGTIHARIKKESWTQDLSTKVTDITNKIKEIKQDYVSAQLPLIQERISAQLTLINIAEDFITIGAKLNLQAMQELQYADVKTKIIGLNGLKATMGDLVKLVGLQKDIELLEQKDNSTLQIHLVGTTNVLDATLEDIEQNYLRLVEEGKIVPKPVEPITQEDAMKAYLAMIKG